MKCVILNFKIHRNALGGQAVPGPAGEIKAFPRYSCWIKENDSEEVREREGTARTKLHVKGGVCMDLHSKIRRPLVRLGDL